MRPVHNVDALLLLAMALSAKRRPAELVEIIAAADLLQGGIPPESKLAEAFDRLSRHGLIGEAEGGYTLTPEAQDIVSGQRSKADNEERIFNVKEKLSAFNARAEHPPLEVSAEQLAAAILAHQAAARGVGKNLLMPKPKVDEDRKPAGLRQRKPLPAHRRKG